MKTSTHRCFVAIGLSDALRERCAQAMASLTSEDRALRWVRKASLHLTLKFLGDVSPEVIEGLGEAFVAVAAQAPSFELGFHGLGTFGAKRAPRVLWAGVEDGSGRCRALQKSVEDVCARLGFKRERRPYKPHLTLARIRGPLRDRDWLERVRSHRDRDMGVLAVTSFALMKSELLPGGARYEALGVYPLAGGSGSTTWSSF